MCNNFEKDTRETIPIVHSLPKTNKIPLFQEREDKTLFFKKAKYFTKFSLITLSAIASAGMLSIAFAIIISNLTHQHENHSYSNQIHTSITVGGTNLFFHEITSGTCASNGFDSITSSRICAHAVHDHDYDFALTQTNNDNQYIDEIDECSVHIFQNVTNDDTYSLHKSHNLPAADIECTPKTPCFCKTHYFVDDGIEKAHRKNAEVDGQFIVTWDLSLGGQEDLLNNDFLKTGFEQSVKDYINNDILCSDDVNVKGAEFFGVQIPDNEESSQRKWRSVSGNGKCRGKPQKCKKPLDLSALEVEISDDDDSRWLMADSSRVVKVFHNDDEFCDIFLQSTIFDAFKERLQVASVFNYNVDVDVIVALEGALELKYEVSFEPNSAGLDQIELVSGVPKEPIPADTVCSASQCLTQRTVMRNIFEYFDIPWDESKHECLYQGINCDMENMVTNIWLMNNDADSAGKRFAGKTIPDFFGSLPSLEGLFLGGNQLVGSIPSSFGQLRNLKLLWLEDNNLTGSLPTQLGNLRRLLELNINGNILTGAIPTEIQKLRKIRMLNIGKNTLAGAVSKLVERESTDNTASDTGCSSFPNPLAKMRLHWIGQEKRSDDTLFESLTTLVLEGNRFTGTVPAEIFTFPKLEDLNLANNGLTGTLPEELGSLQSLRVVDLHGNSFTGTISTNIGQLRQLKIFNIHGNDLKGTFPTEFGKLTSLTELVLDNNFLIGEVPSEIGVLSKLTHLTFSGNRMSGDIPSELGNVVSIKHLDFRGFTFGKIDEDSSDIKNDDEIDSVNTNDDIDGNNTIDDNDDIDVDYGPSTSPSSLPSSIPSIVPSIVPSRVPSIYPMSAPSSSAVPSGVPSLHPSPAPSISHIPSSSKQPSVVPSISKVPSSHPSMLPSLNPSSEDVGGNNRNNGNNGNGNNKNTKYNSNKKKATGTIPTELGKLENWEYVVFEDNGVKGPIPTEFGDLKSVRVLWLEDQQFSGPIPEELGKLEKLSVLATGNNKLEGSIPSTLGNITSLEYLSIGGNTLTGEVPTELGNLANLIYIFMGDQNITGTLPSEFGNMASLEYLYIQNTGVTGSLPTEIGNLTNLIVFSAGGCALSGPIPTQLGNLQLLTGLNLAENSLTGTIPTELGQLESTLSIDLTSNEFTGNIPSELASIATLTKLLLCDNNLTGSIPSEFVFLTSLLEIHFCNNELTGTIPLGMGMGSSRVQSNDRRSGLLQIINLGTNALSGGIPSDFGLHNDLNTIIIAYSDENSITGTIPTEFGNLQSLLSLSAVGNRLSGSVPSELGAISTLSSLNLGSNLLAGTIPSEVQSIEDLTFMNITDNAITGDMWFMCDLNAFVVNEGMTVNCSNYCDTADEECNSNSIGSATCADIDCSGSGVPSCTDLCRLDYSTCSASVDEILLELDLQTDSNGWQTSWHITDSTDTAVWKMDAGSYRNSASVVEYRCMERDCYTFEIFDSGGDGICCGENNDDRGSYTVLVDGASVPWTKLNFASSASHNIGTCTGAPFPSTMSLNPSTGPTLWPSLLPSVHPSEVPSIYPTPAPSFISSTIPTLLPTSLPSEHPTSIPSEAPSSVPSLHPSTVPTLLPTSLPSEHPTSIPSEAPSSVPSLHPSTVPSLLPTSLSSVQPSSVPSEVPSSVPSLYPSTIPSIDPTSLPSQYPSSVPSVGPSFVPSLSPSQIPSISPVVQTKVLAPDGAGSDFFGLSVSISGSVMLMGAYGDDDNGSQSGSAYVFTTGGQFVTKLVASDGALNHQFGYGVSVDGSTIVVGAIGDDPGQSGSAYVFDTAGTFVRKLVAPDAAVGDNFGISVGVSGSTIVVGSQNDDGIGSAYVFDTSGTFLTKLVPGDGASGDLFGWSVAISGSTIVVGSFRNNASGTNSGAAYIFDTTGQQVAKLVAPDAAANDFCGFHVAISGPTILVGCYQDDDNGSDSGSANVFDTAGTFVTKLVAPDAAGGDNFGVSVGVSESYIVVGAWKDDGIGSAYVFDTTGRFVTKLVPSDGVSGNAFGRACAISGSTVLLGAYQTADNGANSGSAYFGSL